MAKGGARPGAGRKPGSKNKATVGQLEAISDLAREHTETAINALAQIATAGESEAARVSAATAILDRGYGKPKQMNEHSGKDGGDIIFKTVIEKRAD